MILALRKRTKKSFSTAAADEFRLSLIVGVAVALAMMAHLAFLTKYPVVFIDESWEADAAWNWLKTGRNFAAMDTGTRSVWPWPFIGHLPLVISFATLGLGLFQARLVSWVFGILLLIVTSMVGRRIHSRITGALATLLLCLSSPFVQASRYVRPDMMLAAVVMLAYYVGQRALEEDRWWAHVLAGLLLGLSLDIHPNAILFGLGLAALYLDFYGRSMLRKAGTWLCAAGGLLGIAFFVALHILPDPSVYFTMMDFNLASTERLPLQGLNPLSLLTAALQEVGRYHFYLNNVDFALIGASVAYLVTRRSSADRRLLVYVGTAFAAFVLFAGNKNDIYTILFYPFFMLMVAETLVSLIRAGKASALTRVFATSLLALFLVKSGMHYGRPAWEHRTYDYYAITERIKESIPPGGRVMGTPFWWLGLAEYDYRMSLGLTYYHYYNGYSLTEGLETARPDILIMDELLSGMRVRGEGFPPGPGFQVYNLPAKEFNDFLAQRGEKVDEFTDPWHGRFVIYAIDWN